MENSSAPQDAPTITCVLCLDYAVDPVVTQCGHIFCWEELLKYFSDKSLMQCPVCKSNIDPYKSYSIRSSNTKTTANSTRPKFEQPEQAILNQNRPGIFSRFLNSMGYYGTSSENNTMQMVRPDEREVQTNKAAMYILLAGFLLIFSLFYI